MPRDQVRVLRDEAKANADEGVRLLEQSLGKLRTEIGPT